MPNRIIRSELLDSEAWLSLKGNEDRCAYLAVLLTADNFGDLPAGPHRLVRLWRPFGIDSVDKATKALSDLADFDLVRRYEVDGKPYLHIPRFGQRMRYTRHAWPLSPWATTADKQQVDNISPPSSGDSRKVAAKDAKKEVEVEKKRNKETPARAISALVHNFVSAHTAGKVNPSGLKDTRTANPKGVNVNRNWKVPSLDDHAGLDRFAIDAGINPQAFPSYASLQKHLIDLVRLANSEERRHTRERPIDEAATQLAHVEVKKEDDPDEIR